MKLLLDDNLYYDVLQLMIYTTFMERTVFLLDLDRLEMARTLVPNLDQGGNVQTVLDRVGGGLHGDPGGSMQCQECLVMVKFSSRKLLLRCVPLGDQLHEEALQGAGSVSTLHLRSLEYLGQWLDLGVEFPVS